MVICGLYWGYIGIMENRMETTTCLFSSRLGSRYCCPKLWRADVHGPLSARKGVACVETCLEISF